MVRVKLVITVSCLMLLLITSCKHNTPTSNSTKYTAKIDGYLTDSNIIKYLAGQRYYSLLQDSHSILYSMILKGTISNSCDSTIYIRATDTLLIYNPETIITKRPKRRELYIMSNYLEYRTISLEPGSSVPFYVNDVFDTDSVQIRICYSMSNSDTAEKKCDIKWIDVDAIKQ